MTKFAVQSWVQTKMDGQPCFGLYADIGKAVDEALRLSKRLGNKMYVKIYKKK